MNDAQQGSEAWVKIRLGRVTASRVADALAKTKTGWGASRKNYRAQLVAERLTGAPTEQYQSAAMAYGVEMEPEARAVYAFQFDVKVEETGFCPHPKILMAGATPDGLIGTDGLIEVKCPNIATHLETLCGAGIDGRYLQQMQFQMASTGRQWCDFVSYDCRLPVAMRLWRQRVYRDDKMIKELEDGVRIFLAEVDEIMADLRKRFQVLEAA